MAGDLRRLLERQGRWHGRGFAAVVDIPSIETTASLLAVVLHEFAHYVETAAQTAAIADAMGVAAFDATLSAPAADVGTERPEPTHDENQKMHSPQFIRLAIHLELRALRHGVRPYCFVVEPSVYHWPDWWRWRGALGDEPRRLAAWPMVSIAAMVPPKSYEQFTAATLAAQQFHF